VEEFLKQQFEEGEKCSLGSVITLTGTARYAKASTVRDYLGRNWPTTGPRLLKLIEELKQQDGIPLNGFLKISHNLDFELNPHSNRKYADYLNYGRDARLSLRYIID